MTDVVTQQVSTNLIIEQNKQPTVVVTGIMGPRGATQIADASQFDMTNLGDGALLVYNSATKKWVATNLLDQQIIESGQF